MLFQGWGVALLVGVPSKDNAFKTHPMNMLNEMTRKGTFFGNYKPKTDFPGVVEKYMNKDMELEKFIAHISEINKAFDYMLKGESICFIITMGAWNQHSPPTNNVYFVSVLVDISDCFWFLKSLIYYHIVQ